MEEEVFDRILKSKEGAPIPERSLSKTRQKAILEDLERVCKFLRAQPTQTVRDKYRKVLGFAPQIIVQYEDLDAGGRQLEILNERASLKLEYGSGPVYVSWHRELDT